MKVEWVPLPNSLSQAKGDWKSVELGFMQSSLWPWQLWKSVFNAE